jgi:HPr kinase/phosphorylase
MEGENPTQVRRTSIANFLATAPSELPLKVLAGESGLPNRSLDSHRIQKFGLALSGFPSYIKKGRIQNIGQSEIEFLDQLSADERLAAFERLDPDMISCILLTKSLSPPSELTQFAETNSIPLLQTSLLSSHAIRMISGHLERLLAPETIVHGVLLEIQSIGVLLIGPSGIGKSECALDLITRGHRLVADDAVLIKRFGETLEGCAPDMTFEFLELHGLGILNIRELFGVSAICKTIRIDLCIELQKWSELKHIERVGVETLQHQIFGSITPKFVLPVSSGRNLATIVDTAVRLFTLRGTGLDPAKYLIEKQAAMVSGEQ